MPPSLSKCHNSIKGSYLLKRQSLKLQATDWAKLQQLAAQTDSLYSGKPSWRRLLARIACGDIKLQVVHTRRRSYAELSQRLKGSPAPPVTETKVSPRPPPPPVVRPPVSAEAQAQVEARTKKQILDDVFREVFR
jgi:hypothetical protein